MSLLTLAQAAPALGCRDPRTARKRLAALGVPVLELDGRLLVDDADISRAIRAHARPLAAAAPARPAGVLLAPGEFLWDSPGNSVAPRRGNVRGRGEREANPGRAESLSGSVDRSSSRPSTDDGGER